MKVALGIAAVCLAAAVVYALLPEGELTLTAHEPIAVGAVDPAPTEEETFLPIETIEPLQGELVAEEELDSDPNEIVLSGRVNPVSGAQPDVHVVARAECEEGNEECPQAETEADPETGEYTLVISPGSWRLVARAAGFLPATEEGLVVSAGEELDGIDLTLQPGERISGLVRIADEEGEEVPAEGVNVAAIANGWERHGLTDAWGHFEIDGLPRGEYSVRAYQAGNGGDETKALTGSSVTLSLGHRVKIRGRVHNPRGFPAEGATIYSDYDPIDSQEKDPYVPPSLSFIGLGMHGCGPSPRCYERTTTDAAGYFEVEMAPGETLTIGAKLGDGVALAGAVAVGAGLVELDLQVPSQQLQLVDDDGRPLAGAKLELAPSAQFFRGEAVTDGRGFFSLPPYELEKLDIPPRSKLLGDVPSDLTVDSTDKNAIIID